MDLSLCCPAAYSPEYPRIVLKYDPSCLQSFPCDLRFKGFPPARARLCGSPTAPRRRSGVLPARRRPRRCTRPARRRARRGGAVLSLGCICMWVTAAAAVAVAVYEYGYVFARACPSAPVRAQRGQVKLFSSRCGTARTKSSPPARNAAPGWSGQGASGQRTGGARARSII